jgi:hypothetical protein
VYYNQGKAKGVKSMLAIRLKTVNTLNSTGVNGAAESVNAF